MTLLVYLGHPAHFHLFKETIKNLQAKAVKVVIVIKSKDVLEKLLIDRIINGLFGCLWQMNPAMQPFLIYGILRRYEKKCIN